MSQQRIKTLMEQWRSAQAERALWESTFNDVKRYVLAGRQESFDRAAGQTRVRRTPPRSTHIYNDTAVHAANSLASAMHGMLVNPSQRWLELSTADGRPPSRDAAAWLYHATGWVLRYLSSPATGFSTAMSEAFLDQCGYGTTVVRSEVVRGELVFQARPLADYWITEDPETRRAERVWRQFELAAWQAAEIYGADALHPDVRRDLDDPQNAERRHVFVHAILRRDGARATGLTAGTMPWASITFDPAREHIVHEGGRRRNPYIVSRWGTRSDSPYGVSPAIRVLPSIKGVNTMDLETLMAAELAIRPPINADERAFQVGPIRLTPGAINLTPRGGNPAQAMQLGQLPQMGEKLIERAELRIEQSFLLDVLTIPQLDRMTATEIIERRQQGLQQTSSVLSNQQSELVGPSVGRTLEYGLESGRLAPPPDELSGRALRAEYRGPMSQAQRVSEGQQIRQAVQAAAEILAMDPDALAANLDTDGATRDIFEAFGIDPRRIRSGREASQIRAQQQQARQQAEQVGQAEQAAGAMRDLAAAESGGGGRGGRR